MLKCKEQFALLLSDQEQSSPVETVTSSLKVDLLVPYPQLHFSSHAELPDSCFAFSLQAGLTWWYIFSNIEELWKTRTDLALLVQVREQHMSG